MNKRAIVGVLIWPLGAYWLARRFHQGTGRSLTAAAIGLIALTALISAVAGGGSGSSPTASSRTEAAQPTTPDQPTTAATTTANKKPKAQWEVIISQSSCQESPSTTSVNCSIGIKNRGTTPGVPTVYALYDYTDGSETTDLSINGTCPKSDDIPAGQLGFVYFCHNYDPLKHNLLRAAVTLNPGAKLWPNIRVADPTDANWPTG